MVLLVYQYLGIVDDVVAGVVSASMAVSLGVEGVVCAASGSPPYSSAHGSRGRAALARTILHNVVSWPTTLARQRLSRIFKKYFETLCYQLTG